VSFQFPVGFCFFWPRVCLLLFVYSIEVVNICLDYCLVLLLRLCPCPPCPPQSSQGTHLRRTSQPKALLHLIGGGSAETPTAQPALRHSYTTLGSAVGTPLGRAHRVVLPSPPTQPPTYGPPQTVGPLSRGGSHRIRWGVWERGGGFEGLQGETQGIGV